MNIPKNPMSWIFFRFAAMTIKNEFGNNKLRTSILNKDKME